jgi:hypothetical protein
VEIKRAIEEKSSIVGKAGMVQVSGHLHNCALSLIFLNSYSKIGVMSPEYPGTADERQFRVMSDREQWFRAVMGQDEVARLITPESCIAIPMLEAISDGLSFKLNMPV